MAKPIDPSKAISILQGLRNEAELGGNVDAASLITHAISLVLEASGDAETDDPAEPEGAGDIATAALAEGLEGAEEPTTKAAGSELRKAGRTFNKGNSSAMHKVIESIAKMLASAGDEVGNKILSMYAPAEPEGMGKAAAADTLRKSISETLEPLSKSIAAISARLDRIERQPSSGGPVLRAADKQLAGQPAAAPVAELPEASPLVREQLDDLLRKSNMAGSAEERAHARQTYETIRKHYR